MSKQTKPIEDCCFLYDGKPETEKVIKLLKIDLPFYYDYVGLSEGQELTSDSPWCEPITPSELLSLLKGGEVKTENTIVFHETDKGYTSHTNATFIPATPPLTAADLKEGEVKEEYDFIETVTELERLINERLGWTQFINEHFAILKNHYSSSQLASLTAEVKEKWISVDERLPEPTRNLISDMVLTARLEAGVITNYYDHEYKTWTVAQDYIITHWMPLPTPPQS